MKTIFGLIFSACLAFAGAGQSLDLGSVVQAGNTSVPAFSANAACIVEIQVAWTGSPTGPWGGAYACGWLFRRNGSDRFEIYPGRPNILCCSDNQILDSLFTDKWAVIRAQMIPSGAGGQVILEAWDHTGAKVFGTTQTYTSTSGSNGNGVWLGESCCGATGMKYGFFRVGTNTVGANAKAPVFHDTGTWIVNYTFDSTLNDSSGNGYHATLSSGSASYATTTHQDVIYGAVTQPDAYSVLSYKRAARVGVPEQLSCANSFSWDNAVSTVTCDWSAVAEDGQTCSFDDATANSIPYITSSAFGQCTVTLTVTDGTNTATAEYPVGAVPADSNGLISYSDANVEKLFGPLTAFGRGGNGWLYLDYNEQIMADAQKTRIEAISPPHWATWQSGTVSWRVRSTTVSGATSSGAGTITVANASQFDNSTFPMILTTDTYNGFLIRVCSLATNTYTVCSSGWGWAGTTPANLSNGQTLYQLKATGSGTSFLTTLCPGGAGTAGTYQIAVEWSHPNIPTGGASPLVSSSLEGANTVCESDTAVYFNGLVNAVSGAVETGVHYAASEGTWVGELGINYYDTGFAMARNHYRTGLKAPRDAWRKLDVYWAWQPSFQGGYNTNPPRRDSMTGVIASAVLDSTQHSAYIWPMLRVWRDAGDISSYACWDDLREGAYKGTWPALAAIFDPDSGNRTTAQGIVTGNLTRDQNCEGADHNAPSAYFPDPGSLRVDGLTLTNGSATVTGTGIPSGFCASYVLTATLTNGSATVTRTAGDAWQSGSTYLMVVLGARPDGSPFHSEFTWTSGNNATLPYAFPGTTGSYTVHLWNLTGLTNKQYYLTFHKTSVTDYNLTNDPGFGQVYSCTWQSSTQITLDRSWSYASITSGGASGGRYTLVGWGTQPFILGIKIQQYHWGYLAGVSGYATLRDNAAEWLYQNGYSSTNGGSHYFRAAPMAEPPWNGLVNVSYGDDQTGIGEARTVAMEAGNSMRFWGLTDATHTTYADTIFNNIWGKSGYNVGTAPAAGTYNAVDANGLTFTSYKWPGFAFGMGMGDQWAGARLPTSTPPTITTSCPLPAGTQGSAYSQTMTASGDTPITWDISTGTLPTGLTLASGGGLTGTPSGTGASSFTLRATNSAGSDTLSCSLTINAPARSIGKLKLSGSTKGNLK